MQHWQQHLDKLKRIRLLLLDVDGVMTDGSIIYVAQDQEIKRFHVRDGLGIRLAMRAGINVGVVTGRQSEALMNRCRNLGIGLIYAGVSDKAALLDRIVAQTAVQAENIAFVGDDLVDLPLMQKIGLSVAVADAHEVVKAHADLITSAPGGAGAVREICEALLKSQGHWESILKEFM
ncbi:MAG: HAD-IIIA family hydrolase [Desulfobacterales bacterium]|nr:HAD-IIIA family hydrolase [Desulfobacterales bacterium]